MKLKRVSLSGNSYIITVYNAPHRRMTPDREKIRKEGVEGRCMHVPCRKTSKCLKNGLRRIK